MGVMDIGREPRRCVGGPRVEQSQQPCAVATDRTQVQRKHDSMVAKKEMEKDAAAENE